MPHDPHRLIVLGIGNPNRGDDGAGPAVVRRLRGPMFDEAELIEEHGEAAALLARLEGRAAAFLIDACASGAPAGSVHRFDAAAAPLPQHAFTLSTHGLGLAEAIELARALRQLPQRCIVYAIEGACFEAGAPLTPAVADAVADVAQRLCADVAGQP
jgi:hydrogenase maturation protease